MGGIHPPPPVPSPPTSSNPFPHSSPSPAQPAADPTSQSHRLQTTAFLSTLSLWWSGKLSDFVCLHADTALDHLLTEMPISMVPTCLGGENSCLLGRGGYLTEPTTTCGWQRMLWPNARPTIEEPPLWRYDSAQVPAPRCAAPRFCPSPPPPRPAVAKARRQRPLLQ